MAATRKFMREWVASKLGRLHEVQISEAEADEGVTDTLYDCPRLADLSEDNERFMDSYLMLDTTTPASEPMAEWRRITAASITNKQVSLSRAFDSTPADGSNAFIYGLLNPDEWNGAINDVLTTLYYPFRLEVPLTETVEGTGADQLVDTMEYRLPAWIMSKGQVLEVRYRNISSGFVKGWEEALPRYRLDQTITGVTLHLIDPPWARSTFELVVEAQRFHSRLDDDTWGTTCPQQLWQAGVEVSVLHKVMKKYGQRFKAQYAQDLAIAEREFAQMRAAMLPVVVAREYAHDDDWSGPDIDSFFLHSGWAGGW